MPRSLPRFFVGRRIAIAGCSMFCDGDVANGVVLRRHLFFLSPVAGALVLALASLAARDLSGLMPSDRLLVAIFIYFSLS